MTTAAYYLRPTRLEDALAALRASPRVILAGGTDYYPSRVGRPLDDDVLDISAISGLRTLSQEDGYWRIPALVTWSGILSNERLPSMFDGLRQAAREVGGTQIQNMGTVCGNLSNASPAADGVPVLLTLDAEVELTSYRGSRRLRVADFVLGNRKTARAPDELMTAVLVKDCTDPIRSTFLKVGARRYLVISIAMVAVVVTLSGNDRIASAAVAVGACSPVAKRLPDLEAALLGERLRVELAGRVSADHLAPLSPIDDIRGTAAYRSDVVLTLVRRAIVDLCR
jgi:CO/xanthine dehydrogenase FAD-binding subunit